MSRLGFEYRHAGYSFRFGLRYSVQALASPTQERQHTLIDREVVRIVRRFRGASTFASLDEMRRRRANRRTAWIRKPAARD
ncbi:MAG: hypothetical protein A2X66_02900 [Ignavibacteria bacterium GWA2_54_16]|nr:MAG: hypothetical protein A2X66_02900 [Ignavibacteria bacterium GWA2_54_16]